MKHSYTLIYGRRPLIQINAVHLLVAGISSVYLVPLSLCVLLFFRM
jgi:hypothetical protein